MDNEIRIASIADTHLGDKNGIADKFDANGIPVRMADGYNAFSEIIDQILVEHEKNPIDLLISGGDTFHLASPSLQDIFFANQGFRRLADHGIKAYICTGNHDSTDIKSKFVLPATAVIDDSHRGINAVYTPYETFEIADGVMLHMLTHEGLDDDHLGEIMNSMDLPQGYLHVLCSHGSVYDPTSKEKWLQPPVENQIRERFVPRELSQDDRFTAKILGHIHSRKEIAHQPDTFYVGSAFRRGWADAAGERGWSLVTLGPDGFVKREDFNIWQRPQVDLPKIDAAGMAGEALTSKIMETIEQTELTAGCLARVKIFNCEPSTNAGIDREAVSKQTEECLDFSLDIDQPVIMDDFMGAFDLEDVDNESALDANGNITPQGLEQMQVSDVVTNFKQFTEDSDMSDTYDEKIYSYAVKNIASRLKKKSEAVLLSA